MGTYYTEYSEFLAGLWPGKKVQKLAIDAGHNCPNRDGTLGTGGCIYCNNAAFSPAYCHKAGSVAAQIEEGKRFFSHKYPEMQYLAYFQAYTSTHAPVAELIDAYEEALSQTDVCGLVVGTRPDCMPEELLSYLKAVNKERVPVVVEYGAETFNEQTLRLINRRHTATCVRNAVRETAEAGIAVGLHLILGLPGEDRNDMLASIKEACSLPVSVLKFHQLQVVKGTALSGIWHARQEGRRLPAEYTDFPEIIPFALDNYLNICAEIAAMVPKHIAIERFTAQCPPALLEAPNWGLKNYQFVHKLEALLRKGALSKK